MQPEPAVLAELVDRIVKAVHPLRIVLFGSAARGELGPTSDPIDLITMSYDNAWSRGRKT
jgi:predicted nucleotidyltransferase